MLFIIYLFICDRRGSFGLGSDSNAGGFGSFGSAATASTIQDDAWDDAPASPSKG